MTDVAEIRNTDMADLPLIIGLFNHSIEYQETKGFPVWRNYDKNAIINDIENGNHYKIVIGSVPAMVFSVCYADPVIWRHMETGNVVYLHRIVVNPVFKGRKLFGRILTWALEHARQKGLAYVRMDTWAANPNIIDYYKGFGFRFVENYTTPDIDALPVHNRKLALALLEYPVK
jgi:ribosomal protein S18 acetylase RimI-like enzyme